MRTRSSTFGAKRRPRSQVPKQGSRAIDRKTTPGLFILRCLQAGIAINDLRKMSIGLIYDIFIEANNDSYEYAYIATQDDIDRL